MMELEMRWQSIISLCGACAITASGLVISTPVLAEPITVMGPRDDDRMVRLVSYRDLNLALAQDEQRLVQRVGGAVRSVCREEMIYLLGHRSCRNRAWNGARPQIAQAIERAKQIARNGFSPIAPVAIVIADGR
jgi:UrcA family protein